SLHCSQAGSRQSRRREEEQMTMRKSFLIIGSALGMIALLPSSASARRRAESRNMRLIAHHELNGNGDGREGLAVRQRPDGRRILYLAHEGQRTCLSILDVTDPRTPILLNQLPSPGPGVARCNSLGLAGNLLAVANQVTGVGLSPAGMWLLDV